MAMLMLNDIFQRTWGERAGAKPEQDYWRTVIPAIKAQWPEFMFMAEAYWDLEWELQQQGFDFCYDKKLYDRMEHGAAENVRLHLWPTWPTRRGWSASSRTMTNRGPRPRFRTAKRRAAAVAVLTLPGARLLHEGQFEGRTVRLPVFLARRPAEPLDQELAAFYQKLLEETGGELFRNGDWRLCERSGWPGNQSCQNILAWCWSRDGERALIVVNYTEVTSQALVRVPWDELRDRMWRLDDRLSGQSFERTVSTYGMPACMWI